MISFQPLLNHSQSHPGNHQPRSQGVPQGARCDVGYLSTSACGCKCDPDARMLFRATPFLLGNRQSVLPERSLSSFTAIVKTAFTRQASPSR